MAASKQITSNDQMNQKNYITIVSTLTAKHRRNKVFFGTYQIRRFTNHIRSQFCCRCCMVATQHSVHLTGGMRSAKLRFFWLEHLPYNGRCPHPTHQQITQTVKPFHSKPDLVGRVGSYHPLHAQRLGTSMGIEIWS